MSARWKATLGTVLVMLAPGALYAFAIFTRHLADAFGWSLTNVTTAFAVANFSLSIGAILGGTVFARQPPRVTAAIGAAMWGLGNMAAGALAGRLGFVGFLFFYGIVGGLGCGLAYITALRVSLKWWPTRAGFGGGLTVMGFGLGAFVYNAVFQRTSAFTTIAAAGKTVADSRAAAALGLVTGPIAAYSATGTLVAVFVVSGLCYLAFGVAAALLIHEPEAAADDVVPAGANVLARSDFYILWALLFLNVAAGIMIVGNAVSIITELTRMSVASAARWYGTIAIANGFGRLLWGTVSDSVGRTKTFVVLLFVQVFAFFVLSALHEPSIVLADFIVILLCYGGGFGVMPALAADTFGLRGFATSYGFVLTAWGVAALVTPRFSAVIQELTGSFTSATQAVGVMLAVGLIFPLLLEAQKPARRRKPSEGLS